MIEGHDGLMDEAGDEVPLQMLFRTLWWYRRTILLAFGITAIASVVAVLFLYAWTPTERLSTLTFQLTFDGAERNEYPNGTKFSSAEIVSSPVLTEVFNANDLQRYVRFSDFKDSMFVLQANRDLELLSFEYQSKLADPKLTPVDRERLEEDFRTKGESLRSAQYSLNMRRSERLASLPTPLLGKILQDTLSTWAKQAAERKGAVRYDIPVLSKNVLQKDVLDTEDYIIAVDMLRTKIERILKTLAAMEEIPGASAVRIGSEQIGLADLIANLEDLNRVKVEPLVGVIRASGLSRNPNRMDQYFEGRLFEVRLAQAERTQRIKSMQEALRDYEQRGTTPNSTPAEGRGQSMTPQLTESFIDRLVELSTRSVDIKYRQDLAKRVIDEGLVLAELNRQAEYYDSMRQSFASARAGANPGTAADVTRRTNLAFDEVTRAMDTIQALYALIAQQNLNPDNVMYSITSPFTVLTTSALSLRITVLYVFVAWLIALIVIPVACLAHHYLRRGTSLPKAPHSTPGESPRSSVNGQVAGV